MAALEKVRGAGQRRLKHGGYSTLSPKLAQQFPRLQWYLRQIRRDLIDHLGGPDKITAPQEVLINGIISKLTVCRLIEVFSARTSPFVLSDLKKSPPVLNLQPALGNHYLAYANAIDRALVVLGLERPKHLTDPLVIDLLRADEAEAVRSQVDKEG